MGRRVASLVVVVGLVVGVGVLTGPAPAGAETFPGGNGTLVYRKGTGNSEIWTMNPDGSMRTHLAGDHINEFVQYGHPSWSPDGTKIVFHRATDIWVMRADGSDQVNLTNSGKNDSMPSWSPDGSKIVFASTGANGSRSIWVMDADGSDPVQITFEVNGSGHAAQDPSWSPDGTTIAYESDRTGDWEVWAVAPNGTNNRQLTTTAGFDGDPNWSPDGRIAFTSARAPETNWDVYVMDADGTSPVNLTPGAGFGENPAWSPDGTRIAFEREYRIWLMGAYGSNPTKIPGSGNDSPLVDGELDVSWQRTIDTTPASRFTPLDPVRILDSRPDPTPGDLDTPWGAGVTRDVKVADLAGVPANATAVALNVTATDTTATSFLSIWPKGQTKPTVSSLNWSAGWTVPNAVTVKVGANRQVSIFNNAGSVNVVIDVVGYYASGSGAGFTSMVPNRLVDSRPDPTPGDLDTPWGAGTTRHLQVADIGGVPANASAVVMNVTATNTSATSFLSIWPKGQDQPTVSSLNWSPGWTIPNAVTVKVGDDKSISVFNYAGQVDVVIDVVGYYRAGTGADFHPLSPVRIQDSRSAFQVGPYGSAWGAGQERSVQVAGVGAVPVDAASVLMNVTVTDTSGSSHLRVWPENVARPLVSSLNWAAGWTIPNAVTAKVSPAGQVRMYNDTGTANVIADVAGWFG